MSSIIILDRNKLIVLKIHLIFCFNSLLIPVLHKSICMSRQFADVAQVVEQLIRNQQASGSSPLGGSS